MSRTIDCEVEETITAFQMPNNNTFPLWCYGAPTITRWQDRVYATVPDVSPDLPPMCNTRLQLFCKQGDKPWQRVYLHPHYNQREPCPVAHLGEGQIIVSTNHAVAPFRASEPGGGQMWYCEPYLLAFNPDQADFPGVIKPAWDEDWPFTDHSYRGLATDPVRRELFVMNIEGYQWQPGPQGRYHWAFRDESGAWAASGRLEFPVRSCYPCISLKDRRVDILATSDIDEPNPEWMAYKRDFAGIPYDFDFRRLYYVCAPDISRGGFNEPILVDTCDETAGHIRHFDLFVDAQQVVHILYLRRNIRQPFMRDRFFPGQAIIASLNWVRIKEGRVISKQVIARSQEDPAGAYWSFAMPDGEVNLSDSFRTQALTPQHAAFAAAESGQLFAVTTLGGTAQDGTDLAKNYLVELVPGQTLPPVEIRLADPMKVFFTAPARNGSLPAGCVDLFGIGKGAPGQVRYARVLLPTTSA